MTLTRFLSLLVPVVLLAPFAGVVGAAAAATETDLTISGKPKLGIFYDDIGEHKSDVVRHRGRLATPDGTPVDGASVHLQRKLAGGEWMTFAQDDVTDTDGRYEFISAIEGNAQYRVSFEGDGVYAASVSDAEPLKAMRDFNTELVEKKHSAVLKGRINPDWDGKTVVWQKRTCKTCTWKDVAKEKSGDNGSWSFAGAYPPVGKKWYYRASVAKTSEFVESYSARLITTTTRSRTPAVRVLAR